MDKLDRMAAIGAAAVFFPLALIGVALAMIPVTIAGAAFLAGLLAETVAARRLSARSAAAGPPGRAN